MSWNKYPPTSFSNAPSWVPSLKWRWDSSSFLARVWPKRPYLYRGRVGWEELGANLPTAFLQLLISKDIYVTANLHTCGQWFHAAHGSFHAEQQERPLCRFPRLHMNSSSPGLPRAFPDCWRGAGRKTQCCHGLSPSLGCCMHAQTLALLSAKLVGLKERNMHETMCLGLLCKGGSPVQMLFPLILFSGKKEEPIRLFSKLWPLCTLLLVMSEPLKTLSSCQVESTGFVKFRFRRARPFWW